MPTTANTPPPGKTTPTPDHTTGAELQTMREAAGLTREELAELVGVQARTLKHWENGRAGVPADVASEAAHWVQCMHATAHRLHAQARSNAELGPVVLTRYKTPEDMPQDERGACPHTGVHGAAVALVVQLLAMAGTPCRVVWFDPAAYGTWIDAQRLADTPDMRAHWAAGQALRAQALPARGDQPPA